MTPARAELERLYRAALDGVDPVQNTSAAVADLSLPPAPGRVHVLALGKAASGMAHAAVTALTDRGAEPAGGVVVSHAPAPAPHPAIVVVAGDHPLPGEGSARAAVALGRAAAAVGPDDLAVVLLSGGASSLVGAPVDGLDAAELPTLTRTLLGAGVDIGVVNAVRRRVTRWGAGRLAVALAPARVACLVIADVPGYGAEVVGSGPCTPEPMPAAALVESLRASGVWERLSAAVRDRFAGMADGRLADAPGPSHAAFARVTVTLLADNATACASAAEAARAAGYETTVEPTLLAGEARVAGAAIARALCEPRARGSRPRVHVWGGEPFVTLHDAAPDAAGGRMQELALAAARVLHAAGDAARGVTLLAAGSDGRDGPTDAAGAVVDAQTWARIAAAGRDPDADLAAHRSHAALDAAGALVRTGPTGTNVADVVIAVRAS